MWDCGGGSTPSSSRRSSRPPGARRRWRGRRTRKRSLPRRPSSKTSSRAASGTGRSGTRGVVWGGTGVGKSKGVLEPIGRAVLRMVEAADWSFLVIDGKGGKLGTLSDDLFTYAALLGLVPERDDYFNTHTFAWVPGFNWLELIGEPTPATKAERLLEQLSVIFNMDGEYRPWWSEWGKGALVPLIHAGLTLTELLPFVSLSDPAFREAVLAGIGDPQLTAIWEEFRHAFKTPEQAKILGVVRTRAKEVLWNPLTVALYGQARTSVDLVRLMDCGGVFLAKTGGGPRFSATLGTFTAKGILHQLLEAAAARRHGPDRKPCVAILDEFARFVSSDFEEILDTQRGYGVHVILAGQHTGQLAGEELHVAESAMANAGLRFVARVMRRDAEALGL